MLLPVALATTRGTTVAEALRRDAALQADAPEAVERLADRFDGLLPRVRITNFLEDFAEWTGMATCFTHPRTGLPAHDQRVVLTAVLAEATVERQPRCPA